MPIDPSIALSVRQADPNESLGKALSLKSLLGQQQLQEMQIRQAQQQAESERALNEAYRTNVGSDGQLNRGALLSSLANSGQGSRIPALQKQFADADKAGLDVKNTQSQISERDFKLGKERLGVMQAAVSALARKPDLTHDDVINQTAALVQQGVIPAEQGAAFVRSLPGDPARLRDAVITIGLQAADAGKRLDLMTPKFQTIDAGNRVIPGTVDQMTGQFTQAPGAPIVKAPEGFVVGPDGQLTADPGYVRAKSEIAAAGKPVTTINMGQKGFENELKLRGDFKQEPVYKAHQEMQSAYAQIQRSLAQASPAGDLAGATKIMKLLDPGSVVRESELGMAMAATGLLDRAQNYAQNILSGTKLTPSQRADFQRLADALYQESVGQFNAKRGEYEQLGGEYGLNAGRALGPEAAQPKKAAPRGAPVPIKSDADYNSLPSGTRFLAPDGTTRVKP